MKGNSPARAGVGGNHLQEESQESEKGARAG
jgi:hypothetical protein